MSNPIVHFEIPMDDADRARTFYREAFGWRLDEMPEMNYTSVVASPVDENMMPTRPGTINGGMTSRSTTNPVPVITIEVASIDAALAKVVEHGGKVVEGRMAVGDMGFAAYFTDTEGNVTGLWENAS